MAAHAKDRSRSKPNDAKNRVRRGRLRGFDYKDTDLLRRLLTDRGKSRLGPTPALVVNTSEMSPLQ
jgi:ribosomal protein S18